MSSSSKKSKKPIQSTTLLSFFSQPVKPATLSKEPPTSEIIVIDSDEDEIHAQTPHRPTKRKKPMPIDISPSSDRDIDIPTVGVLSKKLKLEHSSAKFQAHSVDHHTRRPPIILPDSVAPGVSSPRASIPHSQRTRSSRTFCGEHRPVTSSAAMSPEEDRIEISDDDTVGSESAKCADGVSYDFSRSDDIMNEVLSPTAGLPTNALSLLMSNSKDNDAWREASAIDVRGCGRSSSRRKAPFYKGFPIAVDAFNYGSIPGVNAYFLTHAHSDHYTNLSSGWKSGPIYCSNETANLIVCMLRVDRQWIRPLPMNVATSIPNSGGVCVTLIEANHCPGSCLFLFEGQQTVHAGDSSFISSSIGSKRIFRYLHCGDFRASPKHALHPAIRGKRIDLIYLDTTYLDPKYVFPSQSQVISACSDLVKKLVSGRDCTCTGKYRTMEAFFPPVPKSESSGGREENVLFVVGTYTIGKERILKAIASTLQSRVYCSARKSAILRCLNDLELHEMITDNPLEANIHLVPLATVTSDALKPYLERFKGYFTRIVGFRPTGWTYTQPVGYVPSASLTSIIAKSQTRTYTMTDLHPARNSTDRVQLYGVPYSEHSSFSELSCFALSVDWDKIIATVNVGNETSRNKMKKWFDLWKVEKRKLGPNYVFPHRTVDFW